MITYTVAYGIVVLGGGWCCSGCCGGRCATCWTGSTPPGGIWIGRAPAQAGAIERRSKDDLAVNDPRRRPKMRVIDLVTRSALTAAPQTLVKDAAIVLAEHGVRLLPLSIQMIG
jgi:hypothetical protein